jgi:hypothetical protein
MKNKITLAFFMMFALAFSLYAKAPLSKGAKQFNFGLGQSSIGLPVYVGIDYAIHNDITVGPQVNFLLDNDAMIVILGRGDYHFNRLLDISSSWDVYAGANVGVRLNNGVDIEPGIQIGGRWYWSKKWGLNLEFSGGNNYGTTLGLSVKF